MKLNLPGILMIFTGGILIYAAKKNRDPRNIIFEALGLNRRVIDPDPTADGAIIGDWVPGKPAGNPDKHPTIPGAVPGAPIVSV